MPTRVMPTTYTKEVRLTRDQATDNAAVQVDSHSADSVHRGESGLRHCARIFRYTTQLPQ